MKTLLLPLVIAAAVAGAKKKPVGPCEPYADVCRHCSDCTQCGHCARDGGKCSVCFKR